MMDSSGRIWRLCRKELRETLRDRRTILTLVLMPLMLYPLLGMTLQRFLLSTNLSTNPVFLIGVASEREGAVIRSLIDDPRSLPPREIREASGAELAIFDVVGQDQMSPDQALEQNKVDISARVINWEPLTIELTAVQGDGASLDARRILIERIQWVKMAVAEEKVASLQSQPYKASLAVQVRTIGVEEKTVTASDSHTSGTSADDNHGRGLSGD